MTKISAIVLVGPKTDPKLLKKTLTSISWCDEVIKIGPDTKGTFPQRRNAGAKKAKGDWLLYVDTDEEVTADLRKEIEELITIHNSPITAYAIPRRNIIFNKEFKHGGQWPDFVKRLFLGSALKGWRGNLHEEPIFSGKLGYLKNPLIHNKHKDLEGMVEKTNEWSEIEARLMFEANHPKMNPLRFVSGGARELWLRMFKQMAFLDGTEGVIYAIYQVYSRLISYSKLWEMQMNTKK